jgi:hypothetical protein
MLFFEQWPCLHGMVRNEMVPPDAFVMFLEIEAANETLAARLLLFGFDQRPIAQTERGLGNVVPPFHRRKLHLVCMNLRVRQQRGNYFACGGSGFNGIVSHLASLGPLDLLNPTEFFQSLGNLGP